MADAPAKKSNTQFEDLMLLLFAFLLVGSAIERAPSYFQEKFGVDIGSPYLTASAGLSATTPVGTKVSAVNGANFYAKSGGEGDAAGAFPPGASLVIAGGPESRPPYGRWWYVEDPASGVGGWVREDDLVRSGAGGLDKDTDVGTKARALLVSAVWKLPGSTEKVGDMAKGAFGVLADGPKEHAGSRWWFFDLEDTDKDGWVPESALVLASDTGWFTGSKVRATHALDLFERAGGGRTLGSVAEGDQMTVVGGPMMVGGAYWWLVKAKDGTEGWVPESALEEGGVRGWVKGAVATALIVVIGFTVLLLGGIVYATVRTGQIRAREARRIREALPKNMEPMRNERWDKVLAHVNSENPSDWRLAILEADIMLDELVTRMGYLGTTLGDKLKQARRGDFRTLDAAWEAHRTRNQIAHEGSDFVLTQHEARRIIALYETVFEEFKYS
jgi:hypothetical protein